ncbi:unnamed protein product, partial [Choristocarpus tenellus]
HLLARAPVSCHMVWNCALYFIKVQNYAVPDVIKITTVQTCTSLTFTLWCGEEGGLAVGYCGRRGCYTYSNSCGIGIQLKPYSIAGAHSSQGRVSLEFKGHYCQLSIVCVYPCRTSNWM